MSSIHHPRLATEPTYGEGFRDGMKFGRQTVASTLALLLLAENFDRDTIVRLVADLEREKP